MYDLAIGAVYFDQALSVGDVKNETGMAGELAIVNNGGLMVAGENMSLCNIKGVREGAVNK